MIPRLWGGASQQRTRIISQEQTCRCPGRFAALIAHRLTTLFSQCVRAIKLPTRQVQKPLVEPQQHSQPNSFPRTIFAPLVKVIVNALPSQFHFVKKVFDRQLSPLASRFKFVENRFDQGRHLYFTAFAALGQAQVGQNPVFNPNVVEDFHERQNFVFRTSTFAPLWKSFSLS